ncbi:hypothetical protein GIB67_017408 [Kingdonia uniflora]|uniref:Calcium uniporter protein C-terminal domain-containing protein n=1 Tax=Kingdonia uniflora TaxID=39325 RepID=A0A7J7M481_9MAGN|nr:hypothetical protein GIB67_017408 [Kingdonia uniflora]
MAFRKTQTLAHRLYPITRITSPFSNTPQTQTLIPPIPSNTTFSRDSSNKNGGFFKWFLQKRDLVQSVKFKSPDFKSMMMGDKLMDKIMGLNRDQFSSPQFKYQPELKPQLVNLDPIQGITVKDAKKLLRLAQLEMLKSTLRRIPKSSISHSEFVKICVQESSEDQGLGLAKCLDDFGAVIVLGEKVFLRPEQVTRAIEGIIPLSIVHSNDPRRKELEKMEKVKTEIDKMADSMVRKELWSGLGFLVVQTAAFMRLTFWELSWDVMEPICFYVTSVYFMAGYAFFLRTAKEPSFEGFFGSRFSAKQKQLMKVHKFDMERFNELRNACYPCSFASEPPDASGFYSSNKTLVGALHS